MLHSTDLEIQLSWVGGDGPIQVVTYEPLLFEFGNLNEVFWVGLKWLFILKLSNGIAYVIYYQEERVLTYNQSHVFTVN